MNAVVDLLMEVRERVMSERDRLARFGAPASAAVLDLAVTDLDDAIRRLLAVTAER